MNNLEKLKELNPSLYEKIRVKYLVNANNFQTNFENLLLFIHEKEVKSMTTEAELLELLKSYDWINNPEK